MTDPAGSSEQSPETERARPHHFGFAFKVFYDFVKYDPIKFRTSAKDGLLTEILRHLWNRVGQGLPLEHRLPPDELTVTTDKMGDRLRVCIMLPPAERFCECMILAVVFGRDSIFSKSKEFKVYTLEQSVVENGKPTTAVCQLGDEGLHAYLGRGPEDLEGFKQWLDSNQ